MVKKKRTLTVATPPNANSNKNPSDAKRGQMANGKFFQFFFVLRNYFSAVPCESALRVINREQEEKRKEKRLEKTSRTFDISENRKKKK